MARESFAGVAAALWASLGLAAPAPAEAASLRIDGRTVRLRPNPDGTQVVVAAEVGALAPAPHRREAQLRQMLRESLGLVLGNRAALTLAEDGIVRAEAAGPCRAADVPLLRALIEDVLHLVEIHGPTLAEAAGPDIRNGLPEDAGSLIFRL